MSDLKRLDLSEDDRRAARRRTASVPVWMWSVVAISFAFLVSAPLLGVTEWSNIADKVAAAALRALLLTALFGLPLGARRIWAKLRSSEGLPADPMPMWERVLVAVPIISVAFALALGIGLPRLLLELLDFAEAWLFAAGILGTAIVFRSIWTGASLFPNTKSSRRQEG